MLKINAVSRLPPVPQTLYQETVTHGAWQMKAGEREMQISAHAPYVSMPIYISHIRQYSYTRKAAPTKNENCFTDIVIVAWPNFRLKERLQVVAISVITISVGIRINDDI